jgi:hypothetical protein
MIRRNEIPGIVDGGNCEQELVALRMMASLHHLRGTDAFEKAKTDAEWLVKNSTNQLLTDLAHGLLTSSEILHIDPTAPPFSSWSRNDSAN